MMSEVMSAMYRNCTSCPTTQYTVTGVPSWVIMPLSRISRTVPPPREAMVPQTSTPTMSMRTRLDAVAPAMAPTTVAKMQQM